MDSKNMHRCFRWFIYVLEIYILYCVQQNPFFGITQCKVRPILVVPAFVGVAVFEKELSGVAFGIVAGALLDVCFGTPVGICSLLMGFVGYVVGVVTTYFMKAGFWTSWLFSGVILAATMSLRFYFAYFLPGYANCEVVWYGTFLPVMIYSVVLAPLVLLFNRAVCYFVREVGGEDNKIGLS